MADLNVLLANIAGAYLNAPCADKIYTVLGAEFYPWAKDEKPKGMPNPYGKPVQLTMFVDASHAANVVTCQSRTGVLIFVNSPPVLW